MRSSQKKKNVKVLRGRPIRRDFKSQKHRRNQLSPSLEELEILQHQVNQLQEQVDYFLLVWARLDMRSFTGLRMLGLLLYFFSLPFRWAKRLPTLMKDPMVRWTGFYWLCFTWVLMKDGGIGEVFNALRHPRRLFGTIDLFYL